MRLRNFFSMLFKKANSNYVISEKDEVERIQEIFEELRDIQTKRQRLEQFIKRINKRQQDLEQYESLSKEEHIKVAKLLDQYKSIMEQRKLMEGRLIRNNPSLRIIQTYERELPEILKEMHQTENNQRYAQSDILYLNEEKDYLYDYRESLVTGYRALKIGSVILTIILGITCLALFTMVQSLQKDIFIPASIISVVALFIGFGILIIKRRIEYELDKNELMQKKVVRLLNKVKIKYFHATNYLNYQYNKLGVNNADQLQGHYNRYLKNKNNEDHYRGMNNQLMEIEKRVFDLLYDKGIERDVFDNIDDWAEIQNSTVLLKNLKQEYENTIKQLKGLGSYEEELCQEAFIIANANPDLTSMVKALMDGYMGQRSKDTLDKTSED